MVIPLAEVRGLLEKEMMMVSHLTTPPANEPGDEAEQRHYAGSIEVSAGQIHGMGNVMRDATNASPEQQKRYPDSLKTALDAMSADVAEVTEADYNRRKREYDRGELQGAPLANPKPTFLSQRHDLLTRDIAKMRSKKSEAQARIAADRRLVFELTQSIRSDEDGLDRLLENEA